MKARNRKPFTRIPLEVPTVDHHFDVYEVSPTVPGPTDRLRDKEVSSAIAKWKAEHEDDKVRR